MLLDGTQEYDEVWNIVFKRLKFNPFSNDKGNSATAILPFEIDGSYSVYTIRDMPEEKLDLMEKLVRNSLVRRTAKGKNGMPWAGITAHLSLTLKIWKSSKAFGKRMKDIFGRWI